MKINLKGKIEYKDLGMGTWVFISESAETYELYNPPSELCKPNLSVEITGKIRDDLMSMAMVGSILEVESFKLLD
jgi:hypothetical protein